MPRKIHLFSPECAELTAVWFLLLVQTGMLSYSATCHSPTDLEPAFLVSGISHLQFGRFELYRVNPPLVRIVAAIPVLAVGCKTDWSHFYDLPGRRTEFEVGKDFLVANKADLIPLIIYARWACIPFSLLGAFVAYCWAKELYGGTAGLSAMTLYVFEPNLLAHGELITPDAAATSLGIVAGFTYWRWLKRPSWFRAAHAGGALGLAELCKLTWVILFGLWPVLWCVWCWMGRHVPSNASARETASSDFKREFPAQKTLQAFAPPLPGDPAPPAVQLIAILLIAVYLINLGYVFDGFGTRLKEFQFVSKSLASSGRGSLPGNRFRDTWIGELPVPVPKQYVLGFDIQKKDFEEYHLPSYLRGEVKEHGGWLYYYIYGLLVKVPCGTCGLLILIIVGRLSLRDRTAPIRDELVLLSPAVVLFVFVSSQMEFNRHLRYVFPSLGLCLIFLGQAMSGVFRRLSILSLASIALVAESVASLVFVYPHHLAYFNSFVGGPTYGHRHLTGSSLDWGQDLLYLRDYVRTTGRVVSELRGSDINKDLVRLVIPNFGTKRQGGQEIIVVSPNCLEKRMPFPPADGRMLSPTMWVVTVEDGESPARGRQLPLQ